MALGGDPTFLGSATEAVDVYINKYKFYQVSCGLSADKLSEARGTTLYRGLTGAIEEYTLTLDIEEQLDFDKLSAKLRERFPFKKREVDRMDTINKVMALKQGNKSFEEYIDKAFKLKPLLGNDIESLLAQRQVNGLRSESIAIAIAIQQALQAEKDKTKPTRAPRKLNIA